MLLPGCHHCICKKCNININSVHLQTNYVQVLPCAAGVTASCELIGRHMNHLIQVDTVAITHGLHCTKCLQETPIIVFIAQQSSLHTPTVLQYLISHNNIWQVIYMACGTRTIPGQGREAVYQSSKVASTQCKTVWQVILSM